MTFTTISMVIAVLSLAYALYTALICSLREHTIESWVYSGGGVALLVCEAGAVVLSFEWNAWRTIEVPGTTFYPQVVAFASFLVIVALPVAVYILAPATGLAETQAKPATNRQEQAAQV